MPEAIFFALLCLSFLLLVLTRWTGCRTLLRLGREQRAFFDEHRTRSAAAVSVKAETGVPVSEVPDVQSSDSSPLHSLADVPDVSVVMVSEGDGSLLEANLPYILHQMHCHVEVVVVDASTADTHTAVSTSDALKRLRQTFPQLRQTYVPASCRNVDRLQAGYTLGIRAARAPWVALTEPDCVPESYEWLSQMLALADGGDVDVVMGYANFDLDEGVAGVRRAAFERLKRFVCYARAALNGRAIGVDGCNVLLRREWFVGQGCFPPTLHFASDAVSLAIDAHISPGRMGLALCPESVVRQRCRHDVQSFAADRLAVYRADRLRSFRGRRLLSWRDGAGDVALYLFLLSFVCFLTCRVVCYLPQVPEGSWLSSFLPYEPYYRLFWLCMDVPALLLLALACVMPFVVFRRITRMLEIPSFGLYPLWWHFCRPWRLVALRWRGRRR